MQSIIKRLREIGSDVDVCGLRGGSTALFLALLAQSRNETVCCLVASDDLMETLARDIPLFTDIDVLVYPSFEIPPYTPLSADPATVAQRLSTLHRLRNETGPAVVLASTEAAMRKVLPASVLDNHCELVMAGEETDRDELINHLSRSGYQQCAMVQHEGDLAVRGGIIDVYAPSTDRTANGPLRLDFFGDTIESIRFFDPVSQRSLGELDEAVLLPASDILFPRSAHLQAWQEYLEETARKLAWPEEEADFCITRLRDNVRYAGAEFHLPLVYEHDTPLQTLFSYLPDQTRTVILEPADIHNKAELVWERIQANYREGLDSGKAVLPPERLFLPPDCLTTIAGSTVHLRTLPDPDRQREQISITTGDHALLRQEIDLARKKRNSLAPLVDRLQDWQRKGEPTIIACRSMRQVNHLRDMLKGYQVTPVSGETPLDLNHLARTDALCLVEHPLSRGFDLPELKIHILSATELFGDKRLGPAKRKQRKGRDLEPLAIDELNPGDTVVHRDHGIGLFRGLMNMEFAGRRGDFMQIEYQGGDKLYVPADRLHWINRYQGLTDHEPTLDRLGSSKWRSTKNKVTEAVWKVAQELLDIYARRELREGHRFSPAGELYHELEQSFPYDETSGQLKAIDNVLDDLTGTRPMDRLICGDVGYGKTEVAARAAFKVIEDGFQVAVLVPTTVLAEQHAATFRERFASFPVRVASINRFRTLSRQREILKDLAAGRIDLIIGTHRLLSKDIVFHKLGLLIIDEEHRFGVSHKEKIKKLRADVDVLTLTATPIPRTLQMSLLGIRDLSIISTPPRKRRSVKTFLARNEDLVIREAVVRELERGGQVFFVHNRVRSIGGIARTINRLVPQARVAVAHGQMPGPELEKIMVRFINHEIDVLVCTTIIESGLDIPNANTIIINRAHQLGLADIYQLRGRVGRSSRQSYAYLLVPSLDDLTKDARRRLQALMDCNELGSGFKLAMNDLQIRGGGNLLGVSQSGHIAAVGYDLYLELLQSTVAELKARAEGGDPDLRPELDPEINLQVNAFLPEDYIGDPAQRYHMYRRIAAAGSRTREELADLRDELADRFGPLPPEAETLLELVGLKIPLRDLGVARLEQTPNALIYTFIQDPPIEPSAILALINRKPGKGTPPVRLTTDNRLIVPYQPGDHLFATINATLKDLTPAREPGNVSANPRK